MNKLTVEQVAIILTPLITLISGVLVARINKSPTAETEIDKHGFFYEQYRKLYEGALRDADNLRVRKELLRDEIKTMEVLIHDLKESLRLYEDEVDRISKELAHWKKEVTTAYELIGKEKKKEQ